MNKKLIQRLTNLKAVMLLRNDTELSYRVGGFISIIEMDILTKQQIIGILNRIEDYIKKDYMYSQITEETYKIYITRIKAAYREYAL